MHLGKVGILCQWANGSQLTYAKTRSKLVSEGKWQDCSNVSNKIYKQGIKGSLEHCANGPIRVSSLLSKTRSKQDIEENWGGR